MLKSNEFIKIQNTMASPSWLKCIKSNLILAVTILKLLTKSRLLLRRNLE